MNNTLTPEQIASIKINLEVSPPEADLIFKALQQMPYGMVSELITKLVGQANAPVIAAQAEANKQGLTLDSLAPPLQ